MAARLLLATRRITLTHAEAVVLVYGVLRRTVLRSRAFVVTQHVILTPLEADAAGVDNSLLTRPLGSLVRIPNLLATYSECFHLALRSCPVFEGLLGLRSHSRPYMSRSSRLGRIYVKPLSFLVSLLSLTS